MSGRTIKLVTIALVLLAALSFGHTATHAQDSGFKQIRDHLKTRYQAKKRGIPLLGLAKFAVRIVKPAGVKSFNITLFEELKNTNKLPDNELSAMMRNSLSPEWLPLVSVRRRNGDQVYVYAREAGKDIRLAVLVINEREAALARVKIDPKALRNFVDNPKILGISLSDSDDDRNSYDNQPQPDKTQPDKPPTNKSQPAPVDNSSNSNSQQAP